MLIIASLHREFVGRLMFGVRYKLWNPVGSTHAKFPAAFRLVAITLFCCQHRWESPLAMLPAEVVMYILNMCPWNWPLRRNCVEKLASAGHAELIDINEQLAAHAEALVHLEAAVQVGVVDQAFPANRGSWLLKVHPHDDTQFALVLQEHLPQDGIGVTLHASIRNRLIHWHKIMH